VVERLNDDQLALVEMLGLIAGAAAARDPELQGRLDAGLRKLKESFQEQGRSEAAGLVLVTRAVIQRNIADPAFADIV
jgi:hypothetical protein